MLTVLLQLWLMGSVLGIGSELPASVDEAARRTLSTTRRTRWLLALSIAVPVAACLAVAVHRGDAVAALPALSLVVAVPADA